MISIQKKISPQLSIFPQAYADPLPQNDVMGTETKTYTLQTVGCHWEFGEDFLRICLFLLPWLKILFPVTSQISHVAILIVCPLLPAHEC